MLQNALLLVLSNDIKNGVLTNAGVQVGATGRHGWVGTPEEGQWGSDARWEVDLHAQATWTKGCLLFPATNHTN